MNRPSAFVFLSGWAPLVAQSREHNIRAWHRSPWGQRCSSSSSGMGKGICLSPRWRYRKESGPIPYPTQDTGEPGRGQAHRYDRIFFIAFPMDYREAKGSNMRFLMQNVKPETSVVTSSSSGSSRINSNVGLWQQLHPGSMRNVRSVRPLRRFNSSSTASDNVIIFASFYNVPWAKNHTACTSSSRAVLSFSRATVWKFHDGFPIVARRVGCACL